jgi:hypothetical protein
MITFDANERSVLAGLADVLIPAGEGFPSAREADVAGEGLNQVLSFRSDLAAGLKQLLVSARGRPPAEVVADLRETDPAGFGILAELVPGAYFLNPQVRERLGYHGQGPRPFDPRPDYLEDDLLQSVIDRGPIYRPTTGMRPIPR